MGDQNLRGVNARADEAHNDFRLLKDVLPTHSRSENIPGRRNLILLALRSFKPLKSEIQHNHAHVSMHAGFVPLVHNQCNISLRGVVAQNAHHFFQRSDFEIFAIQHSFDQLGHLFSAELCCNAPDSISCHSRAV